MIKIDWTQFVRERIWFGWYCVNVLGGKATWQYSLFWDTRLKPVVRIHYEIKHYELDEIYSTEGCEVWKVVEK